MPTVFLKNARFKRYKAFCVILAQPVQARFWTWWRSSPLYFYYELFVYDFYFISFFVNNLYFIFRCVFEWRKMWKNRSFKLNDFSPAALFGNHGWSSLPRPRYYCVSSLAHEKANNQFQPYFSFKIIVLKSYLWNERKIVNFEDLKQFELILTQNYTNY